MGGDSITQLTVFTLATTIVATIIIFLFRLRLRFGLTPLYVTLGVFQPLQILLASSVYAEILPGIIVSPGSVIMFTASLFAILLVYIREDALEARKIIYGIMLANLSLSALMLTFGWQLQLSSTLNPLDLSADLFNQSARITIAGTLALFADVLLIIFIYEAICRWISRSQLLCIYLTVALILVFDSVTFATGAFLGQPNYISILYSGIIGKLIMAVPFALVVTFYLRFGETTEREAHSFEDIFDALSYRQKYQLAQERGNQAEAGLKISEDRYKQLFDNSPVPLWEEEFTELTDYLDNIKKTGVTDFRTFFSEYPDELQTCAGKIIIRDVNRETLKLHKARDKAELLGNLDKIFTEASYDTFREEVIAIAEGASSFEIEGQVKTLDGEVREVTLKLQILKDTRTALLATTDITKRKHAEVEQLKLKEQLTQSQKMEAIGRLAGGVAHDFNNMLGVILGYSGLAMQRTGLDDKLTRDLQEIHNAARRSADLTQQLLAFARKQTVNPKLIDMNEAIESMLKMLHPLIGENIDLSWAPCSAPTPVHIDPAQFNQVLTNLCVNARAAISNVGKLIIETGNVHLDESYCAAHPGFIPGKFAMLSVSDDGCGMEKEVLDHIFEPFYTTKNFGEGTGLGLAMVYGIVKQNNGFINVYSEPDKGTTFRIYLPLQHGAADSAKEQTLTKIPQGRGEVLLLVEDEESLLQLTKRMLEESGYSVLACDRPGKAIDLAREHEGRIHLVLTDVIMPEMNGRELADKLHCEHPDLKVLYMSGYSANTIARHGILDPNVNIIQKPFLNQDLAVKVHEILKNDELKPS